MDILVHKMLDFSKLETDSAKLNIKSFNIKTELELITDMTTKNEIRKELNGLCLALKSSLSPM